MTDHDLLLTQIPLNNCAAVQQNATPLLPTNAPPHDHTSNTSRESPALKSKTYYRWNTGKNLGEYMTSAHAWREHTSKAEFIEAFKQIMVDYKENNDLRALKIEEFLIAEATHAGVLSSHTISTSSNPNKWDK